MHTRQELISSYAEDENDYRELESEIVQCYEGNIPFSKCSWRARIILQRWLSEQELKQKYSNQFSR